MSDSGDPIIDDATAARMKQQADAVAAARDAGWNNPIPFNYESVQGGQAAPDESRDNALWLADAAIYEWQDDFGDVGPENPELEKILYDSDNAMRAGHQIQALSFEVAVQGPGRIHPVREVYTHLHIRAWAFY